VTIGDILFLVLWGNMPVGNMPFCSVTEDYKTLPRLKGLLVKCWHRIIFCKFVCQKNFPNVMLSSEQNWKRQAMSAYVFFG
jgi:hypothetical protein